MRTSRMLGLALVVVVALVGCGRIGFDPELGIGSTETPNGIGCGLRDLAVGGHSSCAIDGNGALSCWGYITASRVPEAVPLPERAVKVRMGHGFACVLLESGKVRCFGNGDDGELGRGSTASSDTPVAPQGDHAYIDIATVWRGVCAVTTGHTVECWGDTTLAAMVQLTPLAVPSLSNVRSLVSSTRVMCADTADNRRFCWGDTPFVNANGSSQPKEVAVTSPIGIGRTFGCVLEGGNVRCLGTTNAGELGDNQISVPNFEETATVVSDVAAVAVGSRVACAIGRAGELSCWGQNRSGEVGTGTVSVQATPARIAIPPTGRVALAFAHACAETSDGVYCWGSDDSGALGRGGRDDDIAGRAIAGLPSSIAEVRVASREAYGCARTTAGEVWCWGQGISGVTGDATRASSVVARKIALPFNAVEIGMGEGFACAHDGTQLMCWGSSSYGGLGVSNGNSIHSTPVAIPGLPANALSSLTASGNHGLCVLAGTTPYCWGSQKNAATTDAVPLAGAPATSVLGGLRPYANDESHQCLLDQTGAAWCWGKNTYGELGRDTGGVFDATPAPVVGGGQYSQIATEAGYNARTCAIPMAGGATVDCWGQYGGAGSFTPTARALSAVPVHIDAGGETLCATFADGTRDCVGDDSDGQYGDGTQSTVGTFRHVTDAAQALSLSGDNACFVESGVVRCVGSMRHGALGADPESATPQRISLTCK